MKKRKDGRYQVSVALSGGQRKVIYGKTKTELKQKIIMAHEADNLAPMFDKVAHDWYSDFWRTVSPKTLSQYDPAFDRIVAQFGNKRIDEIEPANIQAFLNDLKIKGYSASYVKTHRTVMSKIFDFEILRRGAKIKINPVMATKNPRIAKKKKPAATQEQEKTIRQVVNQPFGLFAFLLLNTGCRTQEALALQWRDVDFENRVINIDKAVTFPHNQAVIKETKTVNGVRRIPLMEPLSKQLLSILKECNPNPDDFIFGGNKPLSFTEFNHRWRQYALIVGFREEYFVDENGKRLATLSELQKIPHKRKCEIHLTPHQLRHSFATICFEAGLSPEEAQRFLGHADIRTTVDVYTDIRISKQKIASEKLDKYVAELTALSDKQDQ